MRDQFNLTRNQDICPMCFKGDKPLDNIVHWGRCYRGTGFKDGDPKAAAVVEAFERYLEARESLEVEECCV